MKKEMKKFSFINKMEWLIFEFVAEIAILIFLLLDKEYLYSCLTVIVLMLTAKDILSVYKFKDGQKKEKND